MQSQANGIEKNPFGTVKIILLEKSKKRYRACEKQTGTFQRGAWGD